MKNIKIDDDKLTLSIDLSRYSGKKQYVLKRMLAENVSAALGYLDSLNGKYHYSGVKGFVQPSNSAADVLASKRPSSILTKQREMFNVFGPTAKPVDSTSTWFGVEIECMIPRLESHGLSDCGDEDCDSEDCRSRDSNTDTRQRVADALMDAKIKNVRLVNDGSVTSDERYCGLEIVVLTRLDDLSNLERTCAVLQNLGAKIDASCGLHVHLDCRDGSGRLVANRLVRALPILSAMVPRTRTDNFYCRQDRSRRGNRYAKINTESLKKHNTVEVRLHSGTTDFKKIRNWIMILHSFARSKARFSEAVSVSNIAYVSRKLSWSLDLLNYVSERVLKFTGQQPLTNDHDRNVAASEAA